MRTEAGMMQHYFTASETNIFLGSFSNKYFDLELTLTCWLAAAVRCLQFEWVKTTTTLFFVFTHFQKLWEHRPHLLHGHCSGILYEIFNYPSDIYILDTRYVNFLNIIFLLYQIRSSKLYTYSLTVEVNMFVFLYKYYK